MSELIRFFKDIRLKDVPSVGGKNASLGEMLNTLSSSGIRVPDGFATTAFAFRDFLEKNQIAEKLLLLMKQLDRSSFSNLKELGSKARELINAGCFSQELEASILEGYHTLGKGKAVEVAVRSSATAEDLPQASFAGQHESYLDVKGDEAVLQAVKNCYCSLYTDRAIKYREDNGFAHEKVALSAGIQKMVRADKGCSGVIFTLEPESGFRNIIHISGIWGLGENLVQGTVTPDEFLVFKPSLKKAKNGIVQKRLGEKAKTMIYGEAGGTMNLDTVPEKREQFVIDDREILRLSEWALEIEDHYHQPMDIEWAKDGDSGDLFIIQARPETVHSQHNPLKVEQYRLQQKGKLITSGDAVGSKIATGVARIFHSPQEAHQLKDGEIVVTDLTSPDWDPILKRAAAILTNKGGRTSHASIVARELGVPAIVGCNNATDAIRDGEIITVSCCEGKEGFVYEGKVPYVIEHIDFSAVAKPELTDVLLIVGDPDKAFQLSFYPNDGVGLMRMEFIINHFIQVHPMALVKFDELKEASVKEQIEKLTHHYADKKKYFVDRLAQGVATIAAAFYPKEVLVRMSDFKTNEYANLIGGHSFEPREENPMLGFRGASRYYHELYKEGFALECLAVKKVREEMGLENLKVMIPFCRTLEEGRKVIDVMAENGLDRSRDASLKIYMMAEIPSNVLLAEKFALIFDGFSIGSNDLTQLTLGIDRDSTLVSKLFSEQNEAAKLMIGMMIDKAKAAGAYVGLCGQAPSDYPEFAQFLVKKGISSISFNPDALLKGIENIVAAEKTLQVMG